eukprot:744293_1
MATCLKLIYLATILHELFTIASGQSVCCKPNCPICVNTPKTYISMDYARQAGYTQELCISGLCDQSVTEESQSICCTRICPPCSSEPESYTSMDFARRAGYTQELCISGACDQSAAEQSPQNESPTTKSLSDKIKHIIVLMLENRSFDSMLAFLSETRDDIDGCTPQMGEKCSCPIDPTNPKSKRVYISNDANFETPGDPLHNISNITYQIFGTNTLIDSIAFDDWTNMISEYPAPMNGFISSFQNVVDGGSIIMKAFNENTLPVLTTLANEYAVIDHWFSAFPGHTQPNRIFAMRGHTNGFSRNSDIQRLIEGFDGLNIFKMFDDYHEDEIPWNIFSGDIPNALTMQSIRHQKDRFYDLEDFYIRVAQGDLPLLSWIEPAYFDIDCKRRSQSQHPLKNDVRNGEQLIKDIYESLRVSPLWNDTLFFIYYDEHGGFFDHVPPPTCPNPDGMNSTNMDAPFGPPFDFKRLGVRVPAVLVSPWIEKGTTDPVIASNEEAQYCHSSLIHTLRNEYISHSPSLSIREEWSLTFEHLINLDTMRTDTPLVLPSIYLDMSESTQNCFIDQQNKPGGELHLSMAILVASLCGRDDEVNKYLDSESKLGMFALSCFHDWLAQSETEEGESEMDDMYIWYIIIGTIGGCILGGCMALFCKWMCKKCCCKEKNDEMRRNIVNNSDQDSDDGNVSNGLINH